LTALVRQEKVERLELRVEEENTRCFALNTQLSTINCSRQLLRQEKDEASLSRVCGQDSLSAFILCFAGMKAFLFLDSATVADRRYKSASPPALVSQSPTRFAKIIRETIERSVYDQK
jgi:hypothetical protein